jgi:OOP family OmpA-OmpF porin
MPVAAAPVTPAAMVPAPAAPVEKPLAKLMPEAAPAKAPEPVKPVAPVASAVAAPAPVAIAPAPAVNPEAAAKAEIAHVQAEKAIEDALAHFEFDSAELTATGRAMLDDWIKQTTGDTPILVTGHADRLGPEPYNAKLSQLRAEAVKKYLIGKGKPAKRIEIRAKGEHMPLISCAGDATPETKSCLAPNRRAEITVKPASKTLAKPVVKKAAKR